MGEVGGATAESLEMGGGGGGGGGARICQEEWMVESGC